MIDPRTYDDIVKQTTALVRRYTGWQLPDGADSATASDPAPDAGTALIGLFGHMVEAVISRLNQTPDKYFLAFLDLIGTQHRAAAGGPGAVDVASVGPQ